MMRNSFSNVQENRRKNYIKARISQLMDDMNKAHDQHDKNWYNRLIQELSWAQSQKHNCYLDEVEHWKEKYSYLP